MATDKVFEVTLKVTGQKSLSDVIAVFEDKNMTCEVLRVVQQSAAAPQEQKPHYRNGHGYAGGRRDKGIHGDQLLRELLRDGAELTAEEITKGFMQRHFAESSSSPWISRMRQAGEIERLTSGRFRLVPR